MDHFFQSELSTAHPTPNASSSRLFCGDHRDVLPGLPPDVVDLICTSPNFNVGWPYGGKLDSDNLPLTSYLGSLADLFDGCMQVLRTGGVVAVVVPPAIEWPGTQRLFLTADWVRAHLQEQGWLIH